jgi:hypothetical protein
LKSLRSKPYYRILLWIAASATVIMMIWFGKDLVTDPDWIIGDDYVEYWSAGKLNVSGGNPYDPEQILPLQLGTGKILGVPVMMWNPPWMLSIAMPFGVIDYPISRTIWLFCFVLVIFLCVNSLWTYFGGSQTTRYLSWIIGFTFYPVLEALKSGQANPILLLGVTGFLLSIRKKRYFLAGVFISFLILKPHLLYLFGLAVLIWTIRERRWFVFLGALVSFVFGSMMAWYVNPWVINQYIYAIQNYPPTDWVTPTIGGILRLIFDPDLIFLQFLAPVLGIIWFVFYWLKHRESWNWSKQGPLLVLVSVFTAAYGWSSDQLVSVIALVQVGVMICQFGLNRMSILVTLSYLAINVLAFVISGNAIVLFWLAPALLIWYLLAKKYHAKFPITEESQLTL